jgi:hypothetical protein
MSLPSLIGGLLLALAAALPACAEPALWVARSATATVYLFGTQMLRDHVDWRSPRIDRALAASDDLWLEVAHPSNLYWDLLTPFLTDPAHSLSSKLDQDQRARLRVVLGQAGMPSVTTLEPLRPWLAALLISRTRLEMAGYREQQGVAVALTKQVTASGRPIRGLETIWEQIRRFNALSPNTQIALLNAEIDDLDQDVPSTDVEAAAWLAGDVETLGRSLHDSGAARFPEFYQSLVVERNIGWARRLQERLKGDGVSFVAVGALHLAGPNSLQAELAMRGIHVDRE